MQLVTYIFYYYYLKVTYSTFSETMANKRTEKTVLPTAVEMPRTLQAHSTRTHKAEIFMAEIKTFFTLEHLLIVNVLFW